MIKKLLPIFISALLPMTAFAETTIGVAMAHFDDNFLTQVREAIADQAQKQKDVKVKFSDAQGDASLQQTQVEKFVAQKMSAIIVNPADVAVSGKLIDTAHAAGIPIVFVNRKPDATLGNGAVYVGSDSLVAGQLQMEYLAKVTGGKGDVAILVGEITSDAARDRTKGVKEVVAKNPGMKVVAEEVANFDRSQAITVMNKWIKEGKKFNAIAANNDEMALGALIAMKKAGVSPKDILVTGVDATSDAIASMGKGEMTATVFQDAKGQGAQALDTAVKLAAGDKSVPNEIMIPYQLVTSENLKDYMKK
jgi:inositol transport system substrate-binding protein